MRTVNEIRQAIGKATDELGPLANDAAAFDAKEAEIVTLESELDRAIKAETRSAALARPVSPVAEEVVEEVEVARGTSLLQARDVQSPASRRFEDYMRASRAELGFKKSEQRYNNFGEQLQSVFKHYATKGSQTDPRLVRAPTGAGEVDPTGGGFLVQTDFANAIFMLSHDMGQILSRVNKIPISANANGLKVPGVDETSRATGSRWGGVQSNWQAKGVAGTESRPKFRMVEFDLKKLI